MDLHAMVMTASSRLGVKATQAETFTGPLPGVQQSAFWFTTADEAARFAAGCMAEGLPARSYDPQDDQHLVMVLH